MKVMNITQPLGNNAGAARRRRLRRRELKNEHPNYGYQQGHFIVSGPDVEPIKFKPDARLKTGVSAIIPARQSGIGGDTPQLSAPRRRARRTRVDKERQV